MRAFEALPPIRPKLKIPSLASGVAAVYKNTYTANERDSFSSEAIYVLHAFRKDSMQTRKRDIELARKRLQTLS